MDSNVSGQNLDNVYGSIPVFSVNGDVFYRYYLSIYKSTKNVDYGDVF